MCVCVRACMMCVRTLSVQSYYLQDGVGARRCLVGGSGFTGSPEVSSEQQSHHFSCVPHFNLCQSRDSGGSASILPQVQDTC